MSAITAKASRKMKKYAVLTREPRCFLGSFDFSWEQRKLSEITDKVTEKNVGLQYVETFTNSAEFGIISQRDFFDHDIAKLGSLDGYYIVKNEDFVYNPRISTSAPVGPINRNKLGRTGVMSPLYTVFRPHDIDTTYLEYFFKCGYWHSFMNFNGDSGARSDRFSIKDNVFFQMPIPIPDIDEQRKIGELLTCLDHLITLHQRKCANLCSPSQVVFSLLFATSTFSWEQRKAKEICSIGTGKSNTQDQVDDGKYPFYIRSDVPVRSNKYLYDCEAVITIGDGNIGKVFHYVNGKFDLHQRCYKMTDFKDIWGKYFFYYFSTKFYDRAMKMTAKATVDSVRLEMISEMDIKKPPQISEQKQIAEFFANLDNLITLHQRECISFTGRADRLILTANKKRTTSSWEQRKFSELVQIERGGSPRPIDDFITDAPNGLNWVKIGDAPTQGNYITKTAEKIRPEGLSKTREVHPGDLILSNSMSFGKPYIMGIDGCIHDGWLLIRNTYGVFDLTFLCHLLGTPQMLSQYRSLAAGSTVNNLNKELVGNTVVTIPSITEQRVLGDYLEQLDNLITLHQRKPFLMKWRTSDANRNQTNRLVL